MNKKILAAVAMMVSCVLASGCLEVTTNSSYTNDEAENTTPTTSIGPDHDGIVQLASADIWVVPPLLNGGNIDNAVIWTLSHPNTPANVIIRRSCTANPEPHLWLSDPPDWNGSSALATFHACGVPGEFYSTIELAYDGFEWVGLSATGAATLLPPQ